MQGMWAVPWQTGFGQAKENRQDYKNKGLKIWLVTGISQEVA
jgi:hypothetical protein